MTGLLRSEWTKLWSVRFGAWCTAVYVLVVAALGWLAAAGTQTSPEPDLAVETALTGFGFGQLVVVVLGVLAVTSEFGTGNAVVTFTAAPRRTRLLVAKTAVVAGWVALVSAVLAVLCAVAAARLTAVRGGISLGDPAVLRVLGLQVAAATLVDRAGGGGRGRRPVVGGCRRAGHRAGVLRAPAGGPGAGLGGPLGEGHARAPGRARHVPRGVDAVAGGHRRHRRLGGRALAARRGAARTPGRLTVAPARLAPTVLPAVTATRYVTPLREGGSLPGLMEADDLGTYVVKWRAAGQGVKVLVAEVVCGELARALDLPVPALVTVDVAPELAVGEPDPEVQELLQRSAGRNLGLDYLPGALDFEAGADGGRPGAGRPRAVVRRARGQRRPLVAQPEHAVLARPAAADRPRRGADLPPPLAGCGGRRRPPVRRERARADRVRARRAGGRRGAGARG